MGCGEIAAAPPVADEARRFRGSAPIGGHDSGRESAGTTVGRSEWPRSKFQAPAVRQRRNFGHRNRTAPPYPFAGETLQGRTGGVEPRPYAYHGVLGAARRRDTWRPRALPRGGCGAGILRIAAPVCALACNDRFFCGDDMRSGGREKPPPGAGAFAFWGKVLLKP